MKKIVDILLFLPLRKVLASASGGGNLTWLWLILALLLGMGIGFAALWYFIIAPKKKGAPLNEEAPQEVKVEAVKEVKVESAPKVIPPPVAPKPHAQDAPFSLTRNDILDHAQKMVANNKDYPLGVTIKEKSKDILPDVLYVKEKAFAMLYDRNGIIRLVLRLEDGYGKSLVAKYSGAKPSFLKGGAFFDITISQELGSKEAVFVMLDHAYHFTASV